MVLRAGVLVFCLASLFVSCGPNMHSREKVEAAIRARLQAHAGLDLNQLDMSTTDLKFDKNLAYATVAFNPKGDTNLNSGMVMKYTLEDQHGKWVVIHVGDTQGHAMPSQAGMDGNTLPPGHPPINNQPNQDRNSQ